MLLQNFCSIGVADAETVFLLDGLNDLGGGPNTCLFLLANGVDSKLELALLMGLLLSKLVDVVRICFDPAD